MKQQRCFIDETSSDASSKKRYGQKPVFWKHFSPESSCLRPKIYFATRKSRVWRWSSTTPFSYTGEDTKTQKWMIFEAKTLF